MVVLFDLGFVQICGEHKDSGILQRGCYASPFPEDADGDVPEKNRELLESCKGGCFAFNS